MHTLEVFFARSAQMISYLPSVMAFVTMCLMVMVPRSIRLELSEKLHRVQADGHLGYPIPEEELYQPDLGAQCNRCIMKNTCNGCSRCGKCSGENK